MRSFAATCLALLMAGHGEAHADPGAPQLSPTQGRREDAQRLREQLRDLDRRRPPAPVQTAPPPGPMSDPPSRPAPAVGVVLLTVAGLSALTTAVLYGAESQGASADAGSSDTVKLGITASVITGVLGIAVVLTNRQTTVAPTVTSRSAGLAISGRL